MTPCTTYFVLSILLLVFLALYVFTPTMHIFPPKERFVESNKTRLQDPLQMVVFQGSALPDVPPKPMEFDQHPSLPSVDGKDGPRSMFLMSFNKCDPSCCPSTYSCGGGCVCLTDDQKNFLGTRGNNSRARSGNQQEY